MDVYCYIHDSTICLWNSLNDCIMDLYVYVPFDHFSSYYCKHPSGLFYMKG